jgi:hypothetical protein
MGHFYSGLVLGVFLGFFLGYIVCAVLVHAGTD